MSDRLSKLRWFSRYFSWLYRYLCFKFLNKALYFKVCARKFQFDAKPLTDIVDKMPDNFLATFMDYASQVATQFSWWLVDKLLIQVQFHQKNHKTDKIKMVSVNDLDWKLPVVICNSSKKKSKTVINVLETDFPKFFSSPKIWEAWLWTLLEFDI